MSAPQRLTAVPAVDRPATHAWDSRQPIAAGADLLAASQRFWGKVRKHESCWEWASAIDHNGYGRFKAGKKLLVAHRVAYELAFGPIQPGLHVDHLCRNRACVNPAHLEAVTPTENKLRGMAPAIITHRTGVCARGHDLAGSRRCKVCANDSQVRRRAIAKEAGKRRSDSVRRSIAREAARIAAGASK